jgi:hypothetical protein
MTIKNKNIIIRMTAALFFLAFLNYNIFGYIMGNWSPIVFCEGEGFDEKSTINNFVIEGGGHFLNAYSDILMLLNKIELSDLQGIDYKELQKIVDNAVSSMNNARASYSSLYQLASSTPYNPVVIQTLKNFDYKGFQQENGLNGIIYADMVYYLNRGDVRGFYARLLSDIENILQKINTIKLTIVLETIPEIHALWKLNQVCSATMLLGQFAAEIFYNIK